MAVGALVEVLTRNENKIDAGKNTTAGMMNNSLTSANPTAEKIAPYVLLGMTAVTGLVDAVSFLSLGSVFTANMTGNILILAFATARVSGLSVARSSTALIAFVMGAILGGRITARASADSRIRFAAQAFLLEVSEARNPGSDDDRPNIDGHGHRCGLLTREWQQPEIGEESWFSLGNLFRRSVRCSRYTIFDLSGARACHRNLRRVQCCVVSLIAYVR